MLISLLNKKNIWLFSFLYGLLLVVSPANSAIKVLQGKLTPGSFVLLQISPIVYVKYNNHILKPDKLGRVLIGFGKNAKKEQIIEKLDSNNEVIGEFKLKLKPRSYNIQRITGLSKNTVSPNKKTLIKIRKNIRQAKQARKIYSANMYFKSGFIWPVSGIITGVYGSKRILNNKARRAHLGVDIAAPEGKKLLAPSDGKIILSMAMELSGNTLMIDHGWGLHSTLMHLNKIYVKKGDLVKKGQVVGEVGQTGRATGPHVHWGMSWFNIKLDPALSIMDRVSLKKGDKVNP